MLSTPIPSPPKTPLSVKPLDASTAVKTKRAFVPAEHLTHKPFEALKGLLNAS